MLLLLLLCFVHILNRFDVVFLFHMFKIYWYHILIAINSICPCNQFNGINARAPWWCAERCIFLCVLHTLTVLLLYINYLKSGAKRDVEANLNRNTETAKTNKKPKKKKKTTQKETEKRIKNNSKAIDIFIRNEIYSKDKCELTNHQMER